MIVARAHVERAAEDAREAEDVVDLVGVVRAAGRHDPHVGAASSGIDLGVGVGHREDHRVVVHARERLGGQDARAGEADQRGPRRRSRPRARRRGTRGWCTSANQRLAGGIEPSR